MSWPQGSDPFYQNNTVDNNGRRSYYNVPWVPYMRVDGVLDITYPQLLTSYNTRMATPTHCTLNAIGNYSPITRAGNVTVIATPDGAMPAGTWKLFIALTASNLYYTPPANDYHYNIMLDMLPAYGGTVVDMAGTDPVQVSFDFTVQEIVSPNITVDDNEVRIVVWLQPQNTAPPLSGEVYQALSVFVRDLDPTGVQPAPAVLAMSANYPNPFNPKTVIPVSVREAGGAVLEILTADGRRVRLLHEGLLGAGAHEFVWDGADDAGRPAASGVYLARLTGAAESHSQRMILLK